MSTVGDQGLYLIRHQVAQRITQQQRAYRWLRAVEGNAEQLHVIEAELRWLTALHNEISLLINSNGDDQ